MRTILSIFLALAFSGVSAAQQIEAYLCIPDQSTGFAYNETTKTWETTQFKTDDKYLITRTSEQELGIFMGWAWVVKDFGDDRPSMGCEDDFTESGVLLCKGVFSEMHFNRENLRYLYFYKLGYYSANMSGLSDRMSGFFEEGSNTPRVEIGTCSKL